MAKNLHKGATVYQVRDNTGVMLLHKGVVVWASVAGKPCTVYWLKPTTSILTGLSTKEYSVDLYRTPKRAILGYLKRVKLDLEIQQDELEN